MPTERPEQLPPQQQEQQPGFEGEMTPKPQSEAPYYRGSGKLKDKVAIITGGDSGIGRSVAVLFAREGADVAIGYLNEHEEAAETRKMVEEEGGRCLLVPGDVGNRSFCRQFVQQVVDEFGRLDVLVNNAAVQYVQEELEGISEEQLEKTFRTNVYSMFFLTQAALEHMKEGSSIINTTSVTAFQGNETLIDYSSTKGAILAFTRALSQNLADKNIRVNAVAPGPIWTPLIPASFPPEKVEAFGKNTPMGRPGQPEEVAPCYVFLASEDASYITGQTLRLDGGRTLT